MMSRKLEIGTTRLTAILATDVPGAGGACHNYEIIPANSVKRTAPYCLISFQNGAIKESEPNGIFIEDLLAICIDRLQSFQGGNFRCRENAIALTKIEEAMQWLNSRTIKRQKKGIEGTSINHE